MTSDVTLLARLLASRLVERSAESTDGLSYLDFKRRIWKGYTHTRFQVALDRQLYYAECALRGRPWGRLPSGELVPDYDPDNPDMVPLDRFIVEVPPRHGKTESVMRHWPAWLTGELPWLKVISTSYSAALAYENSRRVRNLIQSDLYQTMYPHMSLAADRASVQQWYTNGGGGMVAAGVGGSVTGFGGNLILVDDPVKSRAEAESAVIRERNWQWFINDLYTRLEPPGVVILTMTRWHEDDLSGRLQREEPGRWTVLRLPALAEEDDPLGRSLSEPLWPKRFGRKVLEKARELMGEYAFSALYQQRPLPAGGALFDVDRLRIMKDVPHCYDVVRFWDLAVTTKKRSSFTVGLKLGIFGDEELIVLDVWRAQKEVPDVHEAVVACCQMDGFEVRARLEGEKGGLVELQYLLRDPRVRGYALDSKPPLGDKIVRAGGVASRVNAGRVHLLEAPWNKSFIDELKHFPAGTWEDQVDAMSGAYAMLAEPSSLSVETFSHELAELLG